MPPKAGDWKHVGKWMSIVELDSAHFSALSFCAQANNTSAFLIKDKLSRRATTGVNVSFFLYSSNCLDLTSGIRMICCTNGYEKWPQAIMT